MSSRSTSSGGSRPCPECPTGQMVRVLASRSYELEGRAVEVEGLMPYECDTCQARSWPDSELQRGREMLAIKVRKAAA